MSEQSKPTEKTFAEKVKEIADQFQHEAGIDRVLTELQKHAQVLRL